MSMTSVGSFNPEKEVRKLQELVKKLEQQNSILRTQQGDEKSETPTVEKESVLAPRQNTTCDSSEVFESDLIEEESWLFQCPRRPTREQLTVSPVQWMREHFDDPSSGLFISKRMLLHKLDEFKLIGKSSKAEGFSKENSPSELNGRAHMHHSPHIKAPALYDLNSRIDSGTFARPKKLDRFAKSSSPLASRVEESYSRATIDRDEPLNDLTDVRVIARLQEESLKQQVHNLTHRSRTGSLASITSSNGSMEELAESPTGGQDRYKTFSRRKNLTKPTTPSPTSSSGLGYRGGTPNYNGHEDHAHSPGPMSGEHASPSRLPTMGKPAASRRSIPRPSMLPRRGRPK